MKVTWQLYSAILKESIADADDDTHDRYCQLGEKQPLLVSRSAEGGIAFTDLFGGYVGNLDPTHAPEVGAKISAGELVLARTCGPCLCIVRPVLLWVEGEEVKRESSMAWSLPPAQRKLKEEVR